MQVGGRAAPSPAMSSPTANTGFEAHLCVIFFGKMSKNVVSEKV